jgi:hypothetical protein
MLFGIKIYSQQLMSLISAIIVAVILVYLKTVISKLPSRKKSEKILTIENRTIVSISNAQLTGIKANKKRTYILYKK